MPPAEIADHSPDVELEGDGGERVLPLFRARFYLTPDLLIFRNVPAAQTHWHLKIHGRFWTEERAPVILPPAPSLVVLQNPLNVAAAGCVVGRWQRSSLRPAPSPVAGCGDSEKSPAGTERESVELLQCNGVRPGIEVRPTALSGCRTIGRREIVGSERTGRAVFESVPAGAYVLRMNETGLPPTIQVVTSHEGVSNDVDIVPRSMFVSGRLSRVGVPVRGLVKFGTGSGISEEDSGLYTAVLSDNPGLQSLQVTVCDTGEKYVDRPVEPLVAGSVYDIDLVAPIHFTVHSRDSSAPVEEARASIHVKSDGGKSVFTAVLDPTAAPLKRRSVGPPQRYDTSENRMKTDLADIFVNALGKRQCSRPKHLFGLRTLRHGCS